MSNLKAALIGLGAMGKNHARVLKSLPGVDLVAVFDPATTPGSSELPIVSSLQELIEIKPDYCVIATPTYTHEEIAVQLMEAGINIFIEKPIFDKIEENVDLVSLIQKNNIKTYIACNLRFHPSIKFLKNFIEKTSKKINEVNVYCGSYLPSWRSGTNYTESYSAKKNMGGGVHLDLIHELDYIIWLFVLPMNYSSKKRKVSQLQIDSYDYCTYNLE